MDSKSRIERLQDANAKITEDLQSEQRKNGELRELLEKKDEVNKSLTKKESEYNLIDFPSVPLKDIETQMKHIEPSICRILVEYLKIDSYKLVRNLAQVTNSDTAANVIAYRDGALGRNEALIQRLEGMKQNEEFVDRIGGRLKVKGVPDEKQDKKES